MHEMSLCEGILDIMQSESSRQDFSRVKKVWLQIGDLSCVEVEAMKFCYEAVIKNTLAENSELIIERLPGKAWCMQCSKSIDIKTRFDACHDCGSYELEVTEGDEMKIKEMEVE